MRNLLASVVAVLLVSPTSADSLKSPAVDDIYWSPVGSGLTNPFNYMEPRAGGLALYNMLGNLIVAGDFQKAGGINAAGIAKWNGSAWTALPLGFNRKVAALTTHGGLLTAGGQFTASAGGGVPMRKVASWNGSNWVDIGTAYFDDATEVHSFCACNGVLWTGGHGMGLPLGFLHPNYGWINNLMGASVQVYSLSCTGDTLWVGSSIGLVAWVNATYIGTISLGDVTAMLQRGDSLIFVGTFVVPGGQTIANVAVRYNGTWSAIGTNFSSSPLAVEVYDGQIVVGGNFRSIGGQPYKYIAAYRNGVWTPLGSGTDSTVYSLRVYNGDLYVGGTFLKAGSDSAKAIARWSKKVACCVASAGNVDCDPSDGVDISDLSALIDNLYISFAPLCCPPEANTDGQPGIDISDLSALIDYLYINFTPPAACQ